MQVAAESLKQIIWSKLQVYFDKYKNKSGQISIPSIQEFIIEVLDHQSQQQVDYVMKNIFRLDVDGSGQVSFIQLGNFLFKHHCGQMSLQKRHRNNKMTHGAERKMTLSEFTILINQAYSFLKVSFPENISKQIFDSVDVDKDKLITYVEYFTVIENYICKNPNYEVDNSQQRPKQSNNNTLSQQNEHQYQTKPPQPIKPNTNNMFAFSDCTFAKKVRARVWQLLIPYDADKNNEFSQLQISNALIGILQQDKNEVQYVVKNVSRFDKDNNNSITYEELTNFCVQWHFGQLAIQRLHRRKFYSEGAKRIMNRQQFGKTINSVLGPIQMVATQDLLDVVFREIDLDHDGWISYEVYFMFLRYYFGGLSSAALDDDILRQQHNVDKPIGLTEDEKYKLSHKDINPFDRFARIIVDQLRTIFFYYDYNKNLSYQQNQIRDIFQKIFKLNNNEVDNIMFNYFNFGNEKIGSITFEELIWIILSIYFIDILFNRKYKTSNSSVWTQSRINRQQFISLIIQACFFIKIKPDRDLLTLIFNELDTDKDGYITYKQYEDFIRKYQAKNRDFFMSKQI